MGSSGSMASVRRLNSVARAMWEMVERTDDQPGTGSATYCSAVSLRQASRTLVLAQRSYANNATTSSCMRISPGLGQGHCRYCRGRQPRVSLLDEFLQLLRRQIAVVDHQLVHESLEVRIARAGPLGNPAAALQQRHTGKPNDPAQRPRGLSEL